MMRERIASESCSPSFPRQVGSVFSPRLGATLPALLVNTKPSMCIPLPFCELLPLPRKLYSRYLQELSPSNQSSKLTFSVKASLHLPPPTLCFPRRIKHLSSHQSHLCNIAATGVITLHVAFFLLTTLLHDKPDPGGLPLPFACTMSGIYHSPKMVSVL